MTNTTSTLTLVGVGLDLERAAFFTRWEGSNGGGQIVLERRSFFHRSVRSLQVDQFTLTNNGSAPVRFVNVAGALDFAYRYFG